MIRMSPGKIFFPSSLSPFYSYKEKKMVLNLTKLLILIL